MNDTQKMLQTIINGQSSLKSELLSKIDKVDRKVDALGDKLEGKIDMLDKKLTKVEKKLTARIDRLGKQLAYLEDDAPTREEFDNLEDRVDKMEHKVVSTV